MTTFEKLANMNAQIVVDAAQLRALIEEDRQATWMDGVEVGMRMRAVKQMSDLERPLSIKEVMKATGLGESSIRNLISIGEIEAIRYKNIDKLFVSQEEVRRFKERYRMKINQK